MSAPSFSSSLPPRHRVRQGQLELAELDLIAPPDLSSPRATLQALRSNVPEARDAFVKGYDRYREEPGYFASPEVSAQVHLAKLLLRRAMATVDLSQVPLVSREETGTEAVLLIEEILQRLPAIDLETVPDVAEVAAEGLTAWTLPYTDIDIVRMAEGPKAGQFVFSADSIAVARDLYGTSGSTATGSRTARTSTASSR